MESSRKRVSIAGVVNGSPPPAHKKMKLEVDEPPQVRRPGRSQVLAAGD